MLSPPIEKSAAPTRPMPVLRRKCACSGSCSGGCRESPESPRSFRIGRADDSLEREADRAAAKVVSGESVADLSRVPITLSRRVTEDLVDQRDIPESVGATLGSAGASLDVGLRRDMESHFAADFSRVKIHRDTLAERSARDVNARAYTVGDHVIFGAREYRPASPEGRRLIAHELAHVVQQQGSSGSPARLQRQSISEPGSSESSPSSNSGSSPAGSSSAGAVAGEPRIDVRATHIGGFLAPLPIWHLFVIFRNAAGIEYYYRGGPGGPPCGADPSNSYGTIQGTKGRYEPGTVDWSPGAPSTTVMTGAACAGKDGCFASELDRIDGTCTDYKPLGPNSNTVARTLLARCGVPERKPVMLAPGWRDPIL